MTGYKRFMIFAVIFLLGAILLSVQVIGADEKPWMKGRDPLKFGGTLTLARGFEPISLDSLLTTYGDQAHIYLSEPPFMYGPGGEFGSGGWLESIKSSDDHLTWTFKIKPGVTFHDGVPLDAEAFAWLLRKRKEDPEVFDYPLTYVPDSDHIVVVDKYTVEIQQEGQPFPELPYTMATPCWVGAVRTPRAVEKYGEDYGYTMAYGNGPFKLEEWIKGDHLTFVRNEDYWWSPEWAWKYSDAKSKEEYKPGPPYLEKLVLKYVPEASTRIAMLKTREVDGIVEVPTLHIDEIKKIPGVTILESPSYTIRAIEYNTTIAPLDELNVRKALNYAVNRQALVDVIYRGYAEPAYSPYCGIPLETENTKHLYKFNPEKAASLLDEAGWVMGKNNLREKDGETLTFELWSSDSTEFRMVAEMVQGMWRNLGVDARLRTFDDATLRARIDNGEHQAVLFEHEWVTKGDMYNWWFGAESKWYPQMTGLDTPELQELVDKTFAAKTMEEVNKSNDDLVNYYYEMAALNALFHPENLMAIYDDVKNVYMSHKNGGWWGYMPRLYDVYLQDVYESNQTD